MPNLAEAAAVVTCQTLTVPHWRPWSDCHYDDSVAVFCGWLPNNYGRESLPSLLTADELARTLRYLRPADRQRFGITRHWLRVLLGRYTRQHPARVRLVSGIHGKPELESEQGWGFNVSHSGNAVLIAVGKGHVGVDVEEINPAFGFQELLADNFSLAGQQYIKTNADPPAAFYELWTRKEALLKATAQGLIDALATVPAVDGVHLIDNASGGITGHWHVDGFSVFGGYSAAVAYETMAAIPQFYSLDEGKPMNRPPLNF